MKTLMLTVLLALSFTGCGLKVDVDPVKVEGEVKHTISLNTTQLVEFFTKYCEDKFDTEAEVDECVAESLATFWAALEHAAKE